MVTPSKTAPILIEMAEILPLKKYKKAKAPATPNNEGTKAINGTKIFL